MCWLWANVNVHTDLYKSVLFSPLRDGEIEALRLNILPCVASKCLSENINSKHLFF